MSDFVIVGGGTAGCILAARLTQDPSVSVTMIEAGGSDRHFLYRMPAGYLGLMKTGMGNWRYETVSQAGLGGRSMYAPRGKVLGGSSSINGLTYVRGNAGDYDQWAQMGLRGWSYHEVLPYFRKLESFAGPASEWRGRDGPIGVRANVCISAMSPVGTAWIEAARQLGYAVNPDVNGARQDGFGSADAMIADGRRQSAATAYLHPARARPNLTVVTGALVGRIDLGADRAVGVTYSRGGYEHHVTADREVILCGGAINSPQLLQLSGIGPAGLLRRHGIAVRRDLPGVGENLQDHAGVMLMQELTEPLSALAHTRPWQSAKALLQYLLFGTGPTTSNGSEVQAFVKSRPDVAYPDIQYHFPMLLFEDHGRRIIQREGFAAYVNASRPRSRGRVAIASPRPDTPPLIDPAYFAEPEDLRVTREGLRIARRLVGQSSFGAFRGAEFAPGASVVSDADLDDYIRRTAMSTYHFVGTCRMGDDDLAVVDDRLRLHDLDGLRVVDASVMPNIVSGNTNAATMMIAEKAADLIREDHGAGGR